MQPIVEERDFTAEEQSQIFNECENVPQSTNVDYRECLAIVSQVENNILGTPRVTLEILGAGFEFLAQESGKRVTPAEVLALLSRPWREVLAELLTYPPAASHLLNTRLAANEWVSSWEVGGWGEPREFGKHARHAFEHVVELLQKVVDLPAIQAEKQRVEKEEALRWEQRLAEARLADQQQAQWMKEVSRGIQQGRRNGLVAQGALLALGVAIGWVAGRKNN